MAREQDVETLSEVLREYLKENGGSVLIAPGAAEAALTPRLHARGYPFPPGRRGWICAAVQQLPKDKFLAYAVPAASVLPGAPRVQIAPEADSADVVKDDKILLVEEDPGDQLFLQLVVESDPSAEGDASEGFMVSWTAKDLVNVDEEEDALGSAQLELSVEGREPVDNGGKRMLDGEPAPGLQLSKQETTIEDGENDHHGDDGDNHYKDDGDNQYEDDVDDHYEDDGDDLDEDDEDTVDLSIDVLGRPNIAIRDPKAAPPTTFPQPAFHSPCATTAFSLHAPSVQPLGGKVATSPSTTPFTATSHGNSCDPSGDERARSVPAAKTLVAGNKVKGTNGLYLPHSLAKVSGPADTPVRQASKGNQQATPSQELRVPASMVPLSPLPISKDIQQAAYGMELTELRSLQLAKANRSTSLSALRAYWRLERPSTNSLTEPLEAQKDYDPKSDDEEELLKSKPWKRREFLFLFDRRIKLQPPCRSYGLLGSLMPEGGGDGSEASPLLLNLDNPLLTVVVGSEGSGKSHTMHTILECVLNAEDKRIGVNTSPFSCLIFAGGCGISAQAGETLGFGGNFEKLCPPSPAAFLSQPLHEGAGAYRVIVLVTPQSYQCAKTVYKEIRGCEVRPLFFSVSDLTPALWASLLLADPPVAPPQVYDAVWRILASYPNLPGKVDFRKMAERLRASPLDPLSWRWIDARLAWVEGFLLEMVAWNSKAETAIRNHADKRGYNPSVQPIIQQASVVHSLAGGTATILDLRDPMLLDGEVAALTEAVVAVWERLFSGLPATGGPQSPLPPSFSNQAKPVQGGKVAGPASTPRLLAFDDADRAVAHNKRLADLLVRQVLGNRPSPGSLPSSLPSSRAHVIITARYPKHLPPECVRSDTTDLLVVHHCGPAAFTDLMDMYASKHDANDKAVRHFERGNAFIYAREGRLQDVMATTRKRVTGKV